ncbi:MAG: glycosyltransferase family 39 protein [Anaerolineae bacterium]|nr:glycosyltransferase family 39 protein [Anaerolineae bacterium]
MDQINARYRNHLSKILILFCLLGIAYVLLIPYGEHPDEADHYTFVWYIHEHKSLPVQSFVREENMVQEGHQPPGYYAAVALLTAWAPHDFYEPVFNPYLPVGELDKKLIQQYLHPGAERFPWKGVFLAGQISRLVSVIMGIAGVWLTYKITRLVVPDNPRIALLAAGIHAFIPQFIFISSGVSNDNGAALMGALIIWQILRLWHKPTNKGLLLLGVMLGIGIIVKVSLMAMGIAVGWMLLCIATRPYWPRLREIPILPTLREMFNKGLLIIAPMPLISGWWFWRNYQLYGDPIGWSVWMSTNSPSFRKLPITIGYALDFLWRQFISFWGVFAWGRIFLPGWLYILLLGVTLIAIVGLVRHLRLKFHIAKHSGETAQWDYLAKIGLLGLILVTFLISTWRLGLKLDMVASQGRFLLPVISSITIMLTLGWLEWWPYKHYAQVSHAITGGLFLLSASALLYSIIPVYIRPIREALPATANLVQSEIGPWALVGWEAPPLKAGEDWPLTLYWQTHRPLSAEEQNAAPVLFVHLVNAEGQPIVKWDGVPTQGRIPPPAWDSDIIIEDSVSLRIPEIDEAQLAQVYIGFYIKESDNLNRIEVKSTTQPTLPGTLVLGPVMVRPKEQATATPQKVTDAQFGDIKLLGYDLETITDGDNQGNLRIVFYWQAEDALSEDYTVFAHLVKTESLVAQGDGPPCNGNCPTSLWVKGDVWADKHIIPASNVLDTGYEIRIGWYNFETGERLPVTDANGEPQEHNQLVLNTELP